jgi:Core-2/I-Branching enzyme
MSVAYVVLAHRAPTQLARLVERLDHPDDRVFVHIDRKVPLAPFASALAPFVRAGRAQFARRRFHCRWADYSLVAATAATLEQALQEASFTHVSLLSGEDYPLAPAETLRAFFAAADGLSFMFHSSGDGRHPPARAGNETWYWTGDLRRVTYRHYRIFGQRLHLPNRFVANFPRLIPPADLQLYQGSQWWTLSREAAVRAVETLVRRPELRRYFRRTWAPDEFVFQTILCNSPLLPKIANDDLHYIAWQSWHPKVLDSDDLPALTDSVKLFARKVDAERDPGFLDTLDRLAESRAAGGLLERLLDKHHIVPPHSGPSRTDPADPVFRSRAER